MVDEQFRQAAKERREGMESRSVLFRRDGSESVLDETVMQAEQDPLLKAFIRRELGASGAQGVSPPHIDIMRKMELVDYEPASDIGHFRFYPKGTLMKDLLEDLAEDIAVRRLGATKIHTPLLYRAEQPDIAEQAASFHERDYKIGLEDRQLLLRFAGDFGLFSMMKSGLLSHRSLPLRVYEISNSFRLEKSGECSGLKRLRAFTMPDVHCFCGSLESGLEEYAKLHHFYDALMNEAGLPFSLAFRTVEDFWRDGKGYVADRFRDSKKDGVVEILREMKHYWNLKNEFQYIDTSGDNVQLSTVQLDISDSERYGLMYVGADGQKKPMVIVHSSMGSIERILGAIIEERAREMQQGKKASFPYWLSPTQMRLVPVNENHVGYCETLASRFPNVRVDIDDRTEHGLNKRIRAAEKEWVPMYMVVGDKEVAEEAYTPKCRRTNEISYEGNSSCSLDKIAEMLRFAQANRPFRHSYLDRRVSRQLRFGSSY